MATALQRPRPHPLEDQQRRPLADGLIANGEVNVHGSGGDLLVYDREFGDFILTCDVKMSQPYCNSGVFLRVSDLKDPVMSGIEIQVYSERSASHNDFGAIYDLVAPKRNASQGSGAWEHLEICCQGPQVSVHVKSELVAEMNCNDLDQPGLRPDGIKHKFGRAIKDFSRRGYVGFQDHGPDVWYKNVKLLEL